MKVTEIVIKIGEIDLSLTPDEARELRDILNELLNTKKTEFVPYPYPVVYPYVPVYPLWTVTTSVSDTGKYSILQSPDSTGASTYVGK